MKTLLVLALGALIWAAPASATIITSPLAVDFRTATWGLADGMLSYTVGNVTATALPQGAYLYQDGTDGLGIRGGESDEVDLEECLVVQIAGGMNLSGAWITDLFDAPDGGVGEYGILDINNGAFTFNMNGNLSHQGNGELFVDFGQTINVTDAKFWADNSITGINPNNNEFSVAGFTENPVPEPTTLLLVGGGMLGAGLMRRRRKA